MRALHKNRGKQLPIVLNSLGPPAQRQIYSFSHCSSDLGHKRSDSQKIEWMVYYGEHLQSTDICTLDGVCPPVVDTDCLFGPTAAPGVCPHTWHLAEGHPPTRHRQEHDDGGGGQPALLTLLHAKGRQIWVREHSFSMHQVLRHFWPPPSPSCTQYNIAVTT